MAKFAQMISSSEVKQAHKNCYNGENHYSEFVLEVPLPDGPFKTHSINTQQGRNYSLLFARQQINFKYALQTYFCAQYLDSSSFSVGSEGASVVTIRYSVACHPLIGVLTTLSQDSRDESAPPQIHLVVK